MSKLRDIVAIERITIDPTAPIVSRLQSSFKAWYCNDRFNILNQYSEINWADLSKENKIYQNTISVPLDKLMDDRAKEIIESNKDKQILALWSGGVDSTGYVCALLKNKAPLDKLKVVASRDSIEEHLKFISFLRNKGVTIQLVEEFELIPFLQKAENSIIIDGCCADFLYGGNTCLLYPNAYNLPWQEGLQQVIRGKGINLIGEDLNSAMDLAYLYQDKLGIKCNQFCEFAFLFMFGHQWSYYPHFVDLKIAPSDNCKNVITYYETIPFQAYAMEYFERITLHNPYLDKRYYKYDLKKYIYDFDGDENYFLNKGKIHSWHSYTHKKHITVLTTDGTYHIINDDSPKHQISLEMCSK